jgi:hypothetical protein
MINRFLRKLVPATASPATTLPKMAITCTEETERPASQCSICREPLEGENCQGDAEKACILPCSHIFGRDCISQWLETSPNHNCPTCRQSMLYVECQHPVWPMDLDVWESRPSKLQKVPNKCPLCRQGGVWQRRIESLERNQQNNEKVLLELGLFLATDFGKCGPGVAGSIADRVEQSRHTLCGDLTDLRRQLEQETGTVW